LVRRKGITLAFLVLVKGLLHVYSDCHNLNDITISQSLSDLLAAFLLTDFESLYRAFVTLSRIDVYSHYSFIDINLTTTLKYKIF